MMEKLVKVLREQGGMTEEGIQATIESMREEDKKNREILKKEPPTFVLNDKAATIVYPNNFTMSFSKEGDISWTYNGKKIESLKDLPPNTEIRIATNQEVMYCIKHIVSLHIKDKQDAAFRWKQVVEQAEDNHRVRYIKGNAKRAFIAGVIHGKNQCGQ